MQQNISVKGGDISGQIEKKTVTKQKINDISFKKKCFSVISFIFDVLLPLKGKFIPKTLYFYAHFDTVLFTNIFHSIEM